MATTTTETLPPSLERARERFERWRKTRKGRPRIPESLWRSAVRAAEKNGIYRTVRALSLDYVSLKKRVEATAAATRNGSAKKDDAPAFFELVPSRSPSARESTIELEDPRGVKLRIHLKSACVSEIAELGQLLWRKDA